MYILGYYEIIVHWSPRKYLKSIHDKIYIGYNIDTKELFQLWSCYYTEKMFNNEYPTINTDCEVLKVKKTSNNSKFPSFPKYQGEVFENVFSLTSKFFMIKNYTKDKVFVKLKHIPFEKSDLRYVTSDLCKLFRKYDQFF